MVRLAHRLADISDSLSVEEFWDLVETVENEMLDFKRGVPDSLYQVIPAMAMTNGGLIVCGVDDHREIVGCSLNQGTQDRIMRYANECDVGVELKSITVGRHELVVVEVPDVRERIVTTPDGRLLRRVGGDSQPLRGDALARFVGERCKRSAEEEPLTRLFSPGDFDLNAVNGALDQQGRPAADFAGLGRALADLNVAEYGDLGSAAGGEPVVMTAAAVLFARDPRQFVPGAEVQLVRRLGVDPGPGPASDRQECSGPLTDVLGCCLAFLEKHTQRYEMVSGLFRESIPEYPTSVIREAVLNALAHRDYGLAGSTVDVTVWDDRIEIHSPGPLPGHITEENMRVEHFSRNRRLMRALRAMNLVEEFGEGVDRMYREMEARLMLPPEFKSTPDSVTVTLRNQFLVDIEELAWLEMLDSWPGSAAERLALVEVRRLGQVPKRGFVELLPGIDVDSLLSSMLSNGLLVRVGRRGGAQYQLSRDVIATAGASGIATPQGRRRLLLDEMRRRSSLSTAEAAKILGTELSSTRRLLNSLVEAGLIHARGNTRARRYFPNDSNSTVCGP
ncbi:MAG: putative DNA binding domain-containing protein [Acidimicrobiaceae bacterium]|nr:putative DNA binding domain-containing protein [Acidimicrobiaceae bacterium]